MGLWDTVEALGVIPTEEALENKVLGKEDPQNIINPNARYIDQICNIKHVYHALSLDDNRANVFTPIILSSNFVASKCKSKDEASIDKIDEVWFAGAHADIGGGYEKNESNSNGGYTDRDLSISGVSLNWMMSKIKRVAPSLLPEYARVFENSLGYVHDAENHDSKYAFSTRQKVLVKYKDSASRYHKLRIHHSVFDRLVLNSCDRAKIGYDSMWYKMNEFNDCFEVRENGSYKYKACNSIERVE